MKNKLRLGEGVEPRCGICIHSAEPDGEETSEVIPFPARGSAGGENARSAERRRAAGE